MFAVAAELLFADGAQEIAVRSGLEAAEFIRSSGVASTLGSLNQQELRSGNDAPEVANSAPQIFRDDTPRLRYYKDARAVIVMPKARVTDVDSPNLDGGKLTVWISKGRSTSNQLALTSSYRFSGDQVLLHGQVIGTRNAKGGIGTKPLIVTFNENATPAAIQRLIRSVTFRTSESKSSEARVVSFQLSDRVGGTSEIAIRTIKPYQSSKISHTLTAPTFGLLPETKVYLQRIALQSQGAPIEAGKQTWIVIHGRNNSAKDVSELARALDRYHKNDQVLVLDWSEGANDNNVNLLSGAGWITTVAKWASNELIDLGISSNHLLLAGHSWGSFVAFEIAKQMPGKVKGLVALDPAAGAYGYSISSVNFARVSQLSWAFYGSNSLFGSASLAGTAQESYLVNFVGPSAPDFFEQHSAPVYVFGTIVKLSSQPHSSNAASLFSLERFENRQLGPWSKNRYDSSGRRTPGQFEAILAVRDSDGDKQWGDTPREIASLRYVDRNSGDEVTI